MTAPVKEVVFDGMNQVFRQGDRRVERAERVLDQCQLPPPGKCGRRSVFPLFQIDPVGNSVVTRFVVTHPVQLGTP